MLNQIKLPPAQLLNAENNKPLSTTVKYVCTQSGIELYPKDIGTYLPLGNMKVEFTKDEMNSIKTFGEPSLVLIGFKPKDRLKIYHNIKAPYFLYPDDERVENSSKFFDGLIETMIKKKKIAIARFIPKNKSKVRFVALIPQKEAYEEEEDAHIPGGLNLVFLPYADELRDTRSIEEVNEMENELIEPNKQQILNAKKLINSMTINFSPQRFENTSLQVMYSYLQALALGENNPEEVLDTLKPDAQGMEAVKSLVLRFRDSIWGDDYVDPLVRMAEEEAMDKKKGKGLGKGKNDQNGDAEDSQPAPLKKKKNKAEDDTDYKELPSPKKFERVVVDDAAAETSQVKKPRARKPKEPVPTMDAEVQPAQPSKSTRGKSKGNPMDAEKPMAGPIVEEDEDSDEEVLRKKGKGKNFAKK